MPPTSTATRQCKGVNKAGGPCRATPLRDSDWCAAHDPTLPESSRFGSSAQARSARGGQKPWPKPTEVARRLVEENVAAILRPHFKALGLRLNDDGSVEQLERGAILTGESKDGEVRASLIEDLGAQIAAAEKLLDRVYGRPKQATEISGPDGGPLTTALITDPSMAAQARDLLRAAAASRED